MDTSKTLPANVARTTATLKDGVRVAAGMPVFRMLRYFSIASLICILAAAVVLVLLYRQTAVEGLQRLGKERNVALAKTALLTMREELVAYLGAVGPLQPGQPSTIVLPKNLQGAIADLMVDNNTVVRIKVYNRQGRVVYSTKTEQIGATQEDNSGFGSAIAGTIMTEFIYRDAFNPFDRETEEDNLIQTYIPIRQDLNAPPVGVFEIYTDMAPLVEEVERMEIVITVSSVVVLTLLYGMLVLIVRRANGIIDTQQQTIRERTEILELLSTQMLKNEEQEKHRLATELHEGIAQTLSAVKLHVESACRLASSFSPQSAQQLEEVVPSIQYAIQEVRSISMALRPSSLDDLGILATLAWLCREVEAIYPGIQIHQQFEVQESQIPRALKVIIYRIAETALNRITKCAKSAMVRIRLRVSGQSIEFLIDDQAVSAIHDSPEQTVDPKTDMALMFVMQRVVNSGGSFDWYPNEWGGITLHGRWVAT